MDILINLYSSLNRNTTLLYGTILETPKKSFCMSYTYTQDYFVFFYVVILYIGLFLVLIIQMHTKYCRYAGISTFQFKGENLVIRHIHF